MHTHDILPHAEASAGLTVQGWGPAPGPAVYAALLLTSTALLTLEIALTRFFSYTIWYHFAYLTISVALLGFGSTGSIVAAFPAVFARRGQRFLVWTLVLAAVATIGGLVFLARFPIEVQNLFHKPLRFSLSLLVYYAIVGTPFLLAGFTITLPFAAWPARMGRLYFWDLLGAAFGCVAVIALIESFGVPGLVFAAAGLLLLAAAGFAWADGRRGLAGTLAAAAALVVAMAAPLGNRLPIVITSSKSLPSLQMPHGDSPSFEQRRDRFSKWTALNRVDAFGWDDPSDSSFWAGIGVGRDWKGTKPPVARLTYDGANGADIYSYHGDIHAEFDFLAHHLLRLPYLLLDRPSVLAIGIGGGIDLLNAIKQGARHATGAELQPETVKLLRERLRDFTGDFYNRPDVTLVASEGRHFVRKSDQVFDLVQITFVDTFAAQAAGAYVLAESYLYTVEAMQDYFRRLDDDGMVTIALGDIIVAGHVPPLATRLAMIGYRALEREGVTDPGRHILMVGVTKAGEYAQNESVMIRKTPFTAEEIETVSAYAAREGFDVLYAPGHTATRLATLLGSDEAARAEAMEQEPFNVEATWDGNPFFYNVGKWKNFSPNSGIFFTLPGSFMGQLVLVLMVLQSTLLGAVLVIAPLLRGARAGLRAPGVASYLSYFLALGVGFMFVEISFVQKFVLFLGSPTYALSVTIFALLLFSAIGSLVSTRFSDFPEAALRRLAPLVAALIVVYTFVLGSIFEATLFLELGWRILIAVLAQMPIGLTLGMFMPLGIACIARHHPRLVPWAWGVNGVGSVTGTTLAVLLAMAMGFRTVAIIAAVLYLIGTTLLLRATAAESRR